MIARLACLIYLVLLLTGCTAVSSLFRPAFEFCPSTTETTHQYFGFPDANDLVIFIHGLCGDATTTWTNPSTHFVFPEALARDFANEKQLAYVVSFDYVSRLQGSPSILSIADHLEFEIGELLKKHHYRTLRIVAHSMGGLVAREYVLRRQHRAHPQLKVTNVVLLATPNNGSELEGLGKLVSSSRQIEELRHLDKGNTYLESINKDWNREYKSAGHPRHVLVYAGYEELPIPVIGQIVKLSSATTNADDSMGFQKDHVDIAKPRDAKDGDIYRWVKAKLEESLEKTARQLLAGLVQQGLLAAEDIPKQFPRTVELLEEMQNLAGTELEKVLAHVKAGQYQAALALLAESESKENQLITNIARRRFAQGEIHELQFEMGPAATYYLQAVQLDPSNASYRARYGKFLTNTGEARSAILQFEEAVRLSRTSHNSYLEGFALSGQGNAYGTLGQHAKAIEFHEQALTIHRKIGNVLGEGNALGNLGSSYSTLGQHAKAIEFHEQALTIHRKIGNVLGEGSTLGNLGSSYSTLGQHAKAIEFHEQALTIHRKIGNVLGEGSTLGNLGIAYGSLKQYPKAIEFHEQALTIHRKIGNVLGEGNALGNLGNAYGSLEQYPKAIEFHEQALTIHRKIGNVPGEGTALGNLGKTYIHLEQYPKAIEFLEQALTIHRKIGNVLGEGNALGNMGKAYIYLEQYANAIEFLEKSREIFESQLQITFPFKEELIRLKDQTQY